MTSLLGRLITEYADSLVIALDNDAPGVNRSIDVGVDEAQETLDELARLGVDLVDVARVLEDEGVAAFAKSFGELLDALEAKAASQGHA
jgi:transaldolase